MIERRRIQVMGIVQGVGFRPFVYSLATRTGLSGYVLNDAAGVTIEAQGERAALNGFVTALREEAPPLAVIERVSMETLPAAERDPAPNGFIITESQGGSERNTFVAPDVATCEDCLRELFDPADRRYRYPFINCTNCGPRYTIIRDVPYDRPLTTMAPFTMCSDCRREYENPADRRFHAQPNACPVCGPQITLLVGNRLAKASNAPSSANSSIDPTAEEYVLWSGDDAIRQAQQLLAAGKIVAVKGLGGYHLACDATDEGAIRRLRRHKRRPDKPFALMAADLPAVEAVCELSCEERALLLDRRRPIVLLQARTSPVAPGVAPGQKRLGMMLPYTPLHHLLLESDGRGADGDRHARPGALSLLVMTSGNRGGEPIAYEEEDAFRRLSPLADAFLTHNRAIYTRCDDSVTSVVGGREVAIRRSRGYAPQPLLLDFEFEQPVLAVGAHLKNSFCLGKGRYAFMGHHVGDLDNVESVAAFRQGVDHFLHLFDAQPEVVAHDQHPDYLSTRYALERREVTHVGVQHHHAHIASVMAEHHLTDPVIGIAFDGAGLGADGTIWGGEVLVCDRAGFERAAYLRPISLPGGEQAIREPWRVAAAWLYRLYGSEWPDLPLDFCRRLDRQQWHVLQQMIDRELNCPRTSSMGRLFDAVAALVGVCDSVNYEGQAAIELEAIADETIGERYTFCLCVPVLDPAPLFKELLSDLKGGVAPPVIAARFHNAVAGLIVAVCLKLRQERGLNQVALSGGVFQNAFLLSRALDHLRAAGFETYTNRRVPANDGGIALGQAAVAAARKVVGP